MKFKNMKIAITDEVHLKAVCEVLESMGYKQDSMIFKNKGIVCTWSLSGTYDLYDMALGECIHHYETATLTDLLKIRDDMVRENVKH